MKTHTFSINLRLICSHFSSVSEICRQTGINRTQFNKYINGPVIPSSNNLKRICDFFGVEEHEILGPADIFSDIIQAKKQTQNNTSTDPFFNQLQQICSDSIEPLLEYTGFYYEYYYSMGFQGNILKSIVEIYEQDKQLAFRRFQRLKPWNRKSRAQHCKYYGKVLFLAERIILIDIEKLRNKEITQTVLYPNYLNKMDYLTGLKLGISVRSSREPCATRVLYQYQGHNANFRHLFRSCGLYDPKSPLIDNDIKKRISNKKNDSDFLFLPKI